MRDFIQWTYGWDKDDKQPYVVTLRTLQNFYAVHALDMGIPFNDLQAQIGVAELKTTSFYLKADINHRWKSYRIFEILGATMSTEIRIDPHKK